MVTVQNSLGSNMITNSTLRKTIEGPTTARVTTSYFSEITSSSLLVSWNTPTNICGSLTRYSIYVNSIKVCVLLSMVECKKWHQNSDYNLSTQL